MKTTTATSLCCFRNNCFLQKKKWKENEWEIHFIVQYLFYMSILIIINTLISISKCINLVDAHFFFVHRKINTNSIGSPGSFNIDPRHEVHLRSEQSSHGFQANLNSFGSAFSISGSRFNCGLSPAL